MKGGCMQQCAWPREGLINAAFCQHIRIGIITTSLSTLPMTLDKRPIVEISSRFYFILSKSDEFFHIWQRRRKKKVIQMHAE